MAFSPKQNAKVNGNILIHLHHKNSQEDMNNVSNIYGLGAGQTQETARGGGCSGSLVLFSFVDVVLTGNGMY